MPRPPNYSQERNVRDRAKANKKSEKLAAKAEAKVQEPDAAKHEASPAAQSND